MKQPVYKYAYDPKLRLTCCTAKEELMGYEYPRFAVFSNGKGLPELNGIRHSLPVINEQLDEIAGTVNAWIRINKIWDLEAVLSVLNHQVYRSMRRLAVQLVTPTKLNISNDNSSTISDTYR